MKAIEITHYQPFRVMNPYYEFLIRTSKGTMRTDISVSDAMDAVHELDYYIKNRISMIAWDRSQNIGKQLHDFQYNNHDIATSYELIYYDGYGSKMRASPVYPT